ncbi:hypothetical protein JOD45_002385 [Scopulibacillus daqui]|uniref:ABC transporter n=1 Tax=Scopulibacillus daqui TaxID=1469162 RepID=A0ABS2Q389_9BACL|nr:DUF3189 family protein [Scopulibacillus daqui]MBM7646159.1 hypothetical protein [Scopulibacillus daqui]
MIYIYNCFGGTHSSALAAAYHLNKLPLDHQPTKEDILRVDIFNKLTYKDRGKFYLHGVDEDNNKVYTLGRGNSKALVPALRHLALILQEKQAVKEPIVISNTSPTVPLAMTFGGFFSRGLKLHFIGVPLLVMGAKKAHQNIINLVNHTKEYGRTLKSEIEILDNKAFKSHSAIDKA